MSGVLPDRAQKDVHCSPKKPPASFAVLVTAAGASRRMGGVKKEYAALTNPQTGEHTTVLGNVVSAFAAVGGIPLMVISVPDNAEAGERAARQAIPARFLSAASPLLIRFAPGGPSRRVSVLYALRVLNACRPDYVLIHDGARPWVDAALILRVMAAVQTERAVAPALALWETPKEVDGAGFVKSHLKRSSIVLAQTPQAFAFEDILYAHECAARQNEALAKEDRVEYTDDAEIWGAFVGPVKTVEGSRANSKITFPEDVAKVF